MDASAPLNSSLRHRSLEAAQGLDDKKSEHTDRPDRGEGDRRPEAEELAAQQKLRQHRDDDEPQKQPQRVETAGAVPVLATRQLPTRLSQTGTATDGSPV